MANLLDNYFGSAADKRAEGPILPKNVDHPPYSVLSISVTSFDEVLAQLNLNDSRQVPTNLDRKIKGSTLGWVVIWRTVANG